MPERRKPAFGDIRAVQPPNARLAKPRPRDDRCRTQFVPNHAQRQVVTTQVTPITVVQNAHADSLLLHALGFLRAEFLSTLRRNSAPSLPPPVAQCARSTRRLDAEAICRDR